MSYNDILQAIKEAWSWQSVVPERILMVSEFGNVVFVDADGVHWRITPEELECTRIAADHAEFKAWELDEEQKSDWQMLDTCAIAQTALGPLPKGKSYTLVVPGVFGHPYSAENMMMIDTEELIRKSGDLAFQIKDLPDGTEVNISIID